MAARAMLKSALNYLSVATPIGGAVGALVGGAIGTEISNGPGEFLVGGVGGMVVGGVAGGVAAAALPFAPVAFVIHTVSSR